MSDAALDRALTRANDSQRKAADPDASVFVTANAGSGKTKVLIDRVARLLLREDDPAAFLCITYTKAAAAEMQRRLFDRLGGWCVLGDAALEQELFDLVGAAEPLPPRFLARARALFAKALETPGGLRIQTIHSFCERLLRRFPLEAGAPPSFEILDEQGADALMAHAWREAIERPEVAQALAHLAKRLAEEALDQLIASVDAQRRVLRAMLRPGLPAAIAQVRVRHGATQSRAAFLKDYIAATPLADLVADCDAIVGASKTDIETGETMRAARAAGADHGRAFELLCGLYLTDKGAARKTLVTKKVADANPRLAAMLATEQSRCLSAIEALKSIDRADDMAALLTLGDGVLGAYARAKVGIGVLDFEDLIERSEALLTAAGAAPWVLYKLDRGIDHILIDEGQDTSPAQWDVLAPLQGEFFVGAGARAKPRTVFAVGDPKQSIYSFQGADPERFRTEAQALSKRAAAADRPFFAPEMTMSFRSAPEVLKAVDAVFAELPLAADEIDAPAVIHHEAKRADHHGVVEWWPLAPRPERPEPQAWTDPVDMVRPDSATTMMARRIAEQAASWVRERALVWDKKGHARAMRPGDIMALVRTRGGVFDALLKAFKSAGLPVAGADRMRLAQEIAVQDMLAFARVALDEGDDYSLACALKSPLIGLDDEALMTLAASRARGERLIDRLRATDGFAAPAALIASVIAARGAHPHDFLALLLETPDARGQAGWKRMLSRLGHAARDPLEELRSRALTAGRAGAPTLQTFVSEIENDEAEVKREMEADHDAVRIMTVHGAKGLEAPVVILADTSRDFELGAQNTLLTADRELYWSPNERSDDTVTRAIRNRTRAAAQREDLRLLYVAMTRARDRLLICGAERGDQTRNFGRAPGSWHERVEEGLGRLADAQPIETPFGDGLRFGREASAPAETRTVQTKAALPDWSARPAPPAPAPAAAMTPSQLAARTPSAFAARAEQRRRYRRGRLIHGLLQRLPDVAPAQRRALGETWLRTRAAAGEDGAALIDEAIAVIEDSRFAIAFGPGSRAEAPLVGEVAGYRVSGVIDRLIVTDREILVLDFKTDRPAPAEATGIAEAYLAQLALYRAVLTRAFPGRAVRCALLWTEAPILMEAPAAALDEALRKLDQLNLNPAPLT